MNLDLDVGPLLQTQKLLDSVIFARRKGYDEPLSAAALEMMNLTGDGNGFDMVTMPMEWRDKVPTANFFQRQRLHGQSRCAEKQRRRQAHGGDRCANGQRSEKAGRPENWRRRCAERIANRELFRHFWL